MIGGVAPRVLVTGIHSTGALHLVAALRSSWARVEIVGSGRRRGGPANLPYVAADLRDRAAVRTLIESTDPEVVFHLGAVRSPDMQECWAVNTDGTRHLVDSCALQRHPPLVVLVSSAAVYGANDGDGALLHEGTALRPVSAYGASKAAAELLALSMHRRGLLPVVVARPFNLIGPGLRSGLAPADFAAQAHAVRAGRASAIHVGNLDVERDFVDVRDTARAILLLAEREHCRGEVFNVASGTGVSVGTLLSMVLACAGVASDVVVTEAAALPTLDIGNQVGDRARIEAATGWRPLIAPEQSVADMLSALSL